MVAWTRLICFIPQGESSRIVYGEASNGFEDIGKAAEAGTLKAKVLRVPTSVFADNVELTDEELTVGRLLGPLSSSDVTDIKCIGLNFKKHILEAGRTLPPYPSVFLKPTTSLADYGEQVPIPPHCQDEQADYEGEFCVVIGKTCRNVPKDQVWDVIAGYTAGDDVSSRKWQRDPKFAGGVPQWCYSKGFDKYAPLGPVLVSQKIVPDPSKLHLKTIVNGELRQDTPISDLCFDVPTLVSFLSQGTTLRAGTVIMTGTPGGVGWAWKPEPKFLHDGDTVEVHISEIGTLRHGIVYEKSA